MAELSRKEKQMLRLLMAKAGIPIKSNLKVAPATARTCNDTHAEFKAFMLKKGITVLKAEPTTYTVKNGEVKQGIRTLCSNGVAYMNGSRLSWRLAA